MTSPLWLWHCPITTPSGRCWGIPPISLGAREFSTQWDAISTPEDQAAFLRNHPTLSTDAGTLSLAQDALHTESMGETFYNLYTHVTYVLPDQVCHQLLPVMTKRYLATAHPIPYADAAALQDAFSTHYPNSPCRTVPSTAWIPEPSRSVTPNHRFSYSTP